MAGAAIAQKGYFGRTESTPTPVRESTQTHRRGLGERKEKASSGGLPIASSAAAESIDLR